MRRLELKYPQFLAGQQSVVAIEMSQVTVPRLVFDASVDVTDLRFVEMDPRGAARRYGCCFGRLSSSLGH